jgi:hypothetical protein
MISFLDNKEKKYKKMDGVSTVSYPTIATFQGTVTSFK